MFIDTHADQNTVDALFYGIVFAAVSLSFDLYLESFFFKKKINNNCKPRRKRKGDSVEPMFVKYI